MNNSTWTGVLPAGTDSGVPASPASAARSSLRRAWGALCGATFVATRASIYLLVIPFTVVVCAAGIALYTAQALTGGHRG
jgi:hypothetical protein